MDYYIYKYVQNNEIIYIGKSTNLELRIRDHKGDRLKNFNGDIYYFPMKNKTAMESYEYFLINKYKPKYNTATMDDEDFIISIQEPKWNLYKEGEPLKSYKTKARHKEIVNKDVNINALKFKNSIAKSDDDNFYKNIYYKHKLGLLECKIISAFLLKYLYQKDRSLSYVEFRDVNVNNKRMQAEFDIYKDTLAEKNLLVKNNNEYLLNIDNPDILETIDRYGEDVLVKGFNATSKFYFYFMDGYRYGKLLIPREIIEEFSGQICEFKRSVLRYLLLHGALFNKKGSSTDIKRGKKITAMEIIYTEAA